MDLIFRFVVYAMIGTISELIFSVIGLKYSLGYEVKRRVPKKYLEGFVSLYMIPIYGLGFLFLFEPLYLIIGDFNWIIKLLIWGITFVSAEYILGFLFHKILKFYPWDFYEPSKYKIFNKGYSLYSYLLIWGLFGLLLEKIVKFVIEISILIK